MKLKKLELRFQPFQRLYRFAEQDILRVYTQDSDMAEAFGVMTLEADEINRLLFDETQEGNLVFPVQNIEGEVEILEDDTPNPDIIGYLVMTAKGMQHEGIDNDRESAYVFLDNFVKEDLEAFLNGHTIECSVRLNGEESFYVRGPYFTLAEAFEELAQEFGYDEIVA